MRPHAIRMRCVPDSDVSLLFEFFLLWRKANWVNNTAICNDAVHRDTERERKRDRPKEEPFPTENLWQTFQETIHIRNARLFHCTSTLLQNRIIAQCTLTRDAYIQASIRCTDTWMKFSVLMPQRDSYACFKVRLHKYVRTFMAWYIEMALGVIFCHVV